MEKIFHVYYYSGNREGIGLNYQRVGTMNKLLAVFCKPYNNQLINLEPKVFTGKSKTSNGKVSV